METKQVITVTTTKGDQSFSFHIPVGTTWGNAVDAAYEILTHVGEMAKQSIAQAKPADNAAPIEPTVVQGE